MDWLESEAEKAFSKWKENAQFPTLVNPQDWQAGWMHAIQQCTPPLVLAGWEQLAKKVEQE